MEMIDTLRADLEGCALEPDVIHAVATFYATALATRAAADWERFYDLLFESLSSMSFTSRRASIEAIMFDSVMRILEDDLGTRLFGTQALQAIRARVRSHTVFRPVQHRTALPLSP